MKAKILQEFLQFAATSGQQGRCQLHFFTALKFDHHSELNVKQPSQIFCKYNHISHIPISHHRAKAANLSLLLQEESSSTACDICLLDLQTVGKPWQRISFDKHHNSCATLMLRHRNVPSVTLLYFVLARWLWWMDRVVFQAKAYRLFSRAWET